MLEQSSLGKTISKHPCCLAYAHSSSTKQYCKISLLKQIQLSGSKAVTSAFSSIIPTNKVDRNLFPQIFICSVLNSLFSFGAAFVSPPKRIHSLFSYSSWFTVIHNSYLYYKWLACSNFSFRSLSFTSLLYHLSSSYFWLYFLYKVWTLLLHISSTAHMIYNIVLVSFSSLWLFT